MIVKMKLSAADRRAGKDLRDVIGHRSDGTPFPPKKKTPKKKTFLGRRRDPLDASRLIAHVMTTIHDPIRERWAPDNEEHGVRLYNTASVESHGKKDARWSLQVRSHVNTKTNGKSQRFAIGTASMSIEDLCWLREQIDKALQGIR